LHSIGILHGVYPREDGEDDKRKYAKQEFRESGHI